LQAQTLDYTPYYKMLLINELSKKINLPIHTIRFYEKINLFQGKKDETKKSNNYTYYDDEVIEKLELIFAAKSIGFTLPEIKELIDIWYSKQINKEEKIIILRQKSEAIDEKIKQLKQVKKQIVAFIKEVAEFDC
jgi:MerR family transcriptional regulator, copper efflux regulator